MTDYLFITSEEYHARPSLSRSQFDDYVKHGAEYYHARHISKSIKREATPAMKRGTILHAAVLENKPLESLLTVWKGEMKAGTKNTNAWKEARADAELTGREIVTADEFYEYAATHAAIIAENAAFALLKRCPMRETSFEWTDEQTGLELRARADAMGKCVIADLKITELPLSTEGIERQFSRRGGNYAMQAAWYRRGMKAITGDDHEFWFIFAQPCEPYTVAVARPDDDWLLQADIDLSLGLEEFAERKAANDWKRFGYGQLAIIQRPAYDKFSNNWE